MLSILRRFGLLISVCFAAHAHGQCPDWRPNSGLTSTPSLLASTVWDPPGPQGPVLVAAGYFSNVASYDGPVMNNIAAWDGVSWSQLGSGIGTSVSGLVEDVIVLNGELVAAGQFTDAGGTAVSNIARWNGTIWQPLGAGTNGRVFSLALHPTGELIVGGDFTMAGGLPASNIARWNFATQTWSTLGAGVTGSVNALAVLQSGDIIAAGGLTAAAGTPVNRIARFNGSAWFSMNGGVLGDQNGSSIASLLVRANGDLIVGGTFITAGSISTNNIAKWTFAGGWAALGTGLFLGSPTVQALREFNGDLIAAGRFIVAGDFTANNIARWNGSTWITMPQGIPVDISNYVQTLSVYNSELFVGGSFPAVNGNTMARSTARWNGSWISMPGFIAPRNQFHYAFNTWNGKLIIYGQLGCLNPNAPNLTRHILTWNGATFTELGNPDAAVTCTAVTTVTNELIAGGQFTTIGGTAASRIARLATPGGTWQAMGAGFNNPAFSLLHNTSDGFIYAGGGFSASGATTMNSIARWTGSAWQAVGSGFNSSVQSLKMYNGQMYAGGFFTMSGATPIAGLARWTGSTWQAVAGYPGGSVRIMEIYQGQLIIGGTFAGLSGSPSIIAYNGSSFSNLGSGGAQLAGGGTASVNGLAVVNGVLYAGGTFATMGGVPADFIASWNGTTWAEVGNGVQDDVRCLFNYNGELEVGGDFALVNNNTVLAPMWARWSDTGAPMITQQPSFVSGGCNATVSFTVVAAPGYGSITYQWRKNGTPLSNGPTWTGSTVSGATTSILTLTGVNSADNADYNCILTNTCGSTTSDAANLSVFSGVAPVFTQHPQPAQGCPSGTVVLQTAVSSLGTPSFQWRKNGVNLNNQVNHISGATTGTLTISPMFASDAGSYDCVAIFSCAVAISNPAAITFCYANCDCSSIPPVLNANDFQCFFNAFAASNFYANCDGFPMPPIFTANDFQCFLNKYALGCP